LLRRGISVPISSVRSDGWLQDARPGDRHLRKTADNDPVKWVIETEHRAGWTNIKLATAANRQHCWTWESD